MKVFRYLPDAVWQRLPLPDFRPRFFLESYSEKLRLYTPHFHQARLMNIFSATVELKNCIEEVEANEKNLSYLICSLSEMIKCWEADQIAKFVLADLSHFKPNFERIVKVGAVDPNGLHTLRVFCKIVLAREMSYEEQMLQALDESVFSQTDLTQAERITSEIDRLTGHYATFLLNKGYSPTYLYNRISKFFRLKIYETRTVHDQFRKLTTRLKAQKVDYTVCFGLCTEAVDVFASVDDDPRFEMIVGIPAEIAGMDLENFTKNCKVDIVARTEINATDYVSAALRSKERLQTFIDVISAMESRASVKVTPNCYVSHSGHVHVFDTDKLLAFLSNEVGSSFEHPSKPMRQLFLKLDSAGKDQLGRSLRYLRLARESTSLEQKLLNLWIALESLFSDFDSTIIGNILEHVPRLYALSSLRRRLIYIRDLLVANTIPVTPLISKNIFSSSAVFDDTLNESHVFAIFRDEAAAIELFQSLNALEHLKFRFMSAFREFKKNEDIAGRLSRSESDVSRQLRRIYRLRNKIAHTGHFKGVRPQLVTHLLDYLAVSYKALADSTITDRQESYSIIELLTAARMSSDMVHSRIDSKEEIIYWDGLKTPCLF